MKSSIKKLVKEHQLIDYLPFGGIEVLSKKLDKDRGTIRGVLQGKWVNIQVVNEALKLIKSDMDRKSDFLQNFEPKIESIINKKNKT